MDSLVLKLTVDDLPKQFKYEIVCIDEEMTVIRSNLRCMNDINQWVFEFGEMTNTRWISRNSDPHGERFVCWKKFVCYRTPYKKRISITNTDCDAYLYIKIKRNIPDVVVEDSYIQMGLPAEIRIKNQHTHDIAGDVIRYRRNRVYQDLKYKFFDYFDAGLGVRESWRYHQRMLLKEYSPQELALCQLFPSERAVRYWRELWRHVNFKPGQTSYQSRFDTKLIQESLASAHNELEMPSEVDPQDPEKGTVEDIICLMRMYDAQYGSSATGLKTLKHRLLMINGNDSWETFLRSAGKTMWMHRDGVSSRDSSLSNHIINKRSNRKYSAALPTADFSHHSAEESDDTELPSSTFVRSAGKSSNREDSSSGDFSLLDHMMNKREDKKYIPSNMLSAASASQYREESDDMEPSSSVAYELSDIDDEERYIDSPSTEDCMQLSKRNERTGKSKIFFSRKPVVAGKQYNTSYSPVDEISRNIQKKRKAKEITAINISRIIRPKDDTDFDLTRICILPDAADSDTSITLSPVKKVMKAKKSFPSKQILPEESTKVRILTVSPSSSTARKRAYVIKI